MHLLVTPERETSAALMMKHLGQCYVQYINRTYRRSGTLWKGRFKSCLAQDEADVLTCYLCRTESGACRMVEGPGAYRWSSYRANGLGKEDPLVCPHAQYLQLGHSREERLAAYRALFSAHVDPEQFTAIRQATNGNYVLGDRRFQSDVEQMLSRRATPGRSGRPAKRKAVDG